MSLTATDDFINRSDENRTNNFHSGSVSTVSPSKLIFTGRYEHVISFPGTVAPTDLEPNGVSSGYGMMQHHRPPSAEYKQSMKPGSGKGGSTY